MQTAPILAAEYTNGSKARPPVLTINRIANGQREFVFSQNVDGKRHAREVAAQNGATPWNF